MRINWSATRKKTEAIATMTNTIAVVIAVSRRDGQVTLRVSSRTSWRNLNGDVAIPVKPRFQSLPVTRNVVTATGLRGPEGFAQLRARAWQEWQDSNLQPPVLETGALSIELHSSESGCGGP